MPEFDGAGDVFAAVRVVDVPGHLRPRHHQHAGAGTHELGVLADRPLAEAARGHLGRRCVGVELQQVGVGVMGDLAALDRARPHLDGAHPARLGEPGLDDRLPPGVVGARLLRPRHRADDEVGLALTVLSSRRPRSARWARPSRPACRPDLPCGAPWSTHFRTVAIWSSVSERSFLNSWMPTVLSMCHGGICRASTRAPDRARPRTRLGVGAQRHRRDRLGPVTRLALGLEDRRDVLGEGRRGRHLGRPAIAGRRSRRRERSIHRDTGNRGFSWLVLPDCACVACLLHDLAAGAIVLHEAVARRHDHLGQRGLVHHRGLGHHLVERQQVGDQPVDLVRPSACPAR